ncbi:uncharacterized protein J3D65DRAFT_697390 [Phyllosticta citribraziliensis]|uniref:Uncharacterized protein n=1 Tax=Phyllosticta citribraziliensis TaxID=989973 RepID=A0ABR1LKJ4_9PEZI
MSCSSASPAEGDVKYNFFPVVVVDGVVEGSYIATRTPRSANLLPIQPPTYLHLRKDALKCSPPLVASVSTAIALGLRRHERPESVASSSACSFLDNQQPPTAPPQSSSTPHAYPTQRSPLTLCSFPVPDAGRSGPVFFSFLSIFLFPPVKNLRPRLFLSLSRRALFLHGTNNINNNKKTQKKKSSDGPADPNPASRCRRYWAAATSATTPLLAPAACFTFSRRRPFLNVRLPPLHHVLIIILLLVLLVYERQLVLPAWFATLLLAPGKRLERYPPACRKPLTWSFSNTSDLTFFFLPLFSVARLDRIIASAAPHSHLPAYLTISSLPVCLLPWDLRPTEARTRISNYRPNQTEPHHTYLPTLPSTPSHGKEKKQKTENKQWHPHATRATRSGCPRCTASTPKTYPHHRRARQQRQRAPTIRSPRRRYQRRRRRRTPTIRTTRGPRRPTSAAPRQTPAPIRPSPPAAPSRPARRPRRLACRTR